MTADDRWRRWRLEPDEGAIWLHVVGDQRRHGYMPALRRYEFPLEPRTISKSDRARAEREPFRAGRLLDALAYNAMVGPWVADAIGATWPELCSWWATDDPTAPTLDHVARLATLTGYGIGWFYSGPVDTAAPAPDPRPIVEGGAQARLF